MRIYLLRHTSLSIEPDIFYGQSDIDVSDSFENEVNNIKDKISKLNIYDEKMKIISSPLTRCKKLARALFSDFSVEERIKELNFGDWENKNIKQIPKEQLENWKNNIMSFQIPNGESNNEFYQRVKKFCDEIIYINQDIFIIAHAGSINCIISYLAKIPFDKLVIENWKKISYGSISLLNKKEKNFELDLFGV